MKIVYVITGLGVGGAERVVCDLADWAAGEGHDVTIVYLTGDAQIVPKHGAVRLVPLRMKKGGRALVRGFVDLVRFLRRTKPDVVHSHLVHANIACRLARLFCRVPCVISSAHNPNEQSKLRVLCYRFTDALATISTNVSRSAVNAFVAQRAVRPGRMRAIYNGISTEKFQYRADVRAETRRELRVANNCVVLLAVGRLTPAKDYPTLLRAIQLLASQEKYFHLYIAGDGVEREALLRLTAELQITKYVTFLGVRDDIPGLMCAADVFVLSSAWEGFGLVVAEAMACERVVVVTDCGGTKEIADGIGFFVPVGSPAALAQALSKVMKLDASTRCEVGLRARKRILECFSSEAAHKDWAKLYRDVMASAHPQRVIQ